MSQSVKNFYDSNAAIEWERLDLPLCQIEFASTLCLIDKYFPKEGRVCDIGGGPGRYAIELIRRGYAVSLLDISPVEIDLARTRLDERNLAAEQLIVGDARDLSALSTDSFDGGLFLGPMYHITDPERRSTALRELARVLKPKGVAIIAFLNSWGLIKTGIADFPDQFRDITTLSSMLGERTFAAESLSGFTECYWSTPDAALGQVRDAGLETITYAGAESFANGMGPLLEALRTRDPDAYANIVEFAAKTSELPQYRDSTDHLHVVVRKTAV